jgi:hypothetical protein
MHEHADLLKLQFDGNRILSCDRVCYIIANPKCLLLRLPTQVNEQGIRITINDTSTPFLICFDKRDCLESPSGFAFDGETSRIQRTFSRVSLPLCTMLSAISTAGILPENVALVYPYVTLAMYFNPS